MYIQKPQRTSERERERTHNKQKAVLSRSFMFRLRPIRFFSCSIDTNKSICLWMLYMFVCLFFFSKKKINVYFYCRIVMRRVGISAINQQLLEKVISV